jgi:hypothetical protein
MRTSHEDVRKGMIIPRELFLRREMYEMNIVEKIRKTPF